MKPLTIVGLVLVILAVLLLGYQGVGYITTRDTVAKAGPVEVQADRTHAFPLAPVLSGGALIAGVALLFLSSRGTRSS